MNWRTRGKIVLSVCVLLAVSAACGRPTPGGGEVFPVAATKPPAATPAQVEHTAAPAVEHATAPAPQEHSAPSAAEPSPVSATEQYATAPAPHGTGAAPLRPNSTPTPGEPAPGGGAVPGGGAARPPSGSSGVCANPYFPVQLGTRWVYNFEGGASSNEITDVRADGFTVTLKQGDLIRPLEWACRPEGLVALSYDGGPAAEAISASSGKRLQFTTTNVTGVTLPANLAPGMTWTQTYDVTMTVPGVSRSVSGTISLTYSAVAIESVTVPAGTFEALKVEIQMTVQGPPGIFGPLGSTVQSASTNWLAPGVGGIKTVSDRGSVTELAVYTPGAP